MIIVRLVGGLGNQMFNYAVARGYQRTNSEQIVLDTHLLQDLEEDIEKIIYRPYSLDIFSNLKASKSTHKLNKLLGKSDVITRIRRKLFNLNTQYIIQEWMTPILLPKSNKNKVVLIGNFQSESYFKSIRQEIMEEFKFPDLDKANEKIKNQILSTENALSIHVRRGDYLSSSNKNIFASVNLEYYKNALTLLQSQLGDKQNTFVFTDDIEWVKKNLVTHLTNITFVEGNYGNDSWKDMLLMSYCQHHIIANSSFSWWGAWLSKRDGINLAPRHWYFPDSYPHDINHIIPKSWTIVDYDYNN